MTGILAFFGLTQGFAVPVETVETTITTQNATQFVEVLKNNVNVRKAPETGVRIMKATMGKTFALVSTVDGWHEIRLDNGQTAYISASPNLTTVTSNQTIPLSMFDGFSGQYYKEYKELGEDLDKRLYEVDMLYRDGYVYVSQAISFFFPEEGTSRYYLTEYYLGTIENNRIVCKKMKVEQFDLCDLEEMTPQSFDDNEMEPGKTFVIDYSPTKKTFFVDGSDM